MGAVLVHIDLERGEPHAASLAALAIGRAVASSWGAALYAGLVAQAIAPPDADPRAQLPELDAVRRALGRGGADRVVVALTAAAAAPRWGASGGAWLRVLDRLRPRLVVFAADAPAAAELGPRTAARLGARIVRRARASVDDVVELRDREGRAVRVSDSGATVALVGGAIRLPAAAADERVELMAIGPPAAADPRVELATAGGPAGAHRALVVLDDEAAADPEVVAGARRLAQLLGAPLCGGATAAATGAIPQSAVLPPGAPLAPELCVAVGSPAIELAGASALVRVGATGGAGLAADGALAGPIAPRLAELIQALEAR